MGRFKFVAIATFVLVTVAFVFWRTSQPPSLEAISAQRADVSSTLAISGVLEAVSTTTVASQVNGARVTSVLADIGARVTAGQLLATLDDSDYRAQLQQADAQIAQANAQASLQDMNASGAKKSLDLAREGARSVVELKQSVTQAETNVNSARLKVLEAQANLVRVRSAGRAEQVRQAQAQLERAEALVQLRQKEFNRKETLYHEGAVSKSDYEVADTALITAKKDAEFAREALRLARSPRYEDVQIAEAQLRGARAVLVGATQTLSLSKQSLDDRLANRQQVVQAETQRDSAVAGRLVSEAGKKVAQSQRSAAEVGLAKTQVKAPFGGTISRRLIEPGQTLGVGTAMFVLADTQNLRVRLDVDEASISLLRVGAPAKVSFDAYPDLVIDAKISEIGSSADFQKGTIEVRLLIPSLDKRLKPELTADVNIITANYKSAITVPKRALINADSAPEVYVVKNGIVESRSVEWKRGNLDEVVISSGLSVGELILLAPRSSTPGSRVKTVAPKAARSK
ncbi:MAG: efflux RND transporter periplasmic adaptor subunit [Fimbriimonadaceae bacterium]